MFWMCVVCCLLCLLSDVCCVCLYITTLLLFYDSYLLSVDFGLVCDDWRECVMCRHSVLFGVCSMVCGFSCMTLITSYLCLS